jgi:hypothetical protein
MFDEVACAARHGIGLDLKAASDCLVVLPAKLTCFNVRFDLEAMSDRLIVIGPSSCWPLRFYFHTCLLFLEINIELSICDVLTPVSRPTLTARHL